MNTVGALSNLMVRSALIGSAILDRKSFWLQAALGRNQMYLHEFRNGAISIGKVSEQLYSEGFIHAYHVALERELGMDGAKRVLREVGTEGAAWEIRQAVEHGVWVPRFLRPFVGKPVLFEKVQTSAVLRTLLKETMRMVFHMIMTEGGWGVVDDLEVAGDPMFIEVHNTPESRQMGPAAEPTCHIMSGIYRAYFQEVLSVDCEVEEVSCQSMGAPRCRFEMRNAVPRAMY